MTDNRSKGTPVLANGPGEPQAYLPRRQHLVGRKEARIASRSYRRIVEFELPDVALDGRRAW